MFAGEHPAHRLGRQPLQDVDVLVDVLIVIEIEKLVVTDRFKSRHHRHDKQQARKKGIEKAGWCNRFCSRAIIPEPSFYSPVLLESSTFE